MPNYTMLNQLPVLSFRTPVGKCVRLCAACLAKKYRNSPPTAGQEGIGKCEKCGDVKHVAPYEAKRLDPVPPKKREKAIPVEEKFNIIRRRK